MKNNIICKVIFRVFSFSLALSFFIIIFLFLSKGFLKRNAPAVIFFDIGQGDSVLLRNIHGINILIDGGPDNKVLKKVGKNLPYFNRKIDFLILSHYHEDHVTGLIEIVNRYKVDRLFLAKDLNTDFLQDLLISKIEKGGIDGEAKIFWIKDFVNLELAPDCYLSFFNPKAFSKTPNDNDSLITKLDCLNNSFLFSGDNEYKVEESLVAENINLSARVFKASHHGSKTSNTLEFLEMISPEYFIISSGLNNRHKHPSGEVLSRVVNLGISIFRTDLDKDITFMLNIDENK